MAVARSRPSASSTSTRASRAAPAMPALASRARNSPMRLSTVSAAIPVAAGEQLGMMLRDQRLDQLLERRPLHHQLELVEREIDAVVGHPPLWEIIGPDALRAIARADLTTTNCRSFGIKPVPLTLIQLGSQDLQRLGLVLVLRFLVLLADHDAGRQMGDPHRAVGCVDRLPARPRRTENIDAKILVLDLDIDLLRFGKYRNRSGGCMDAALRFRHRHPLHPMHARLEFEMGIGA